MKNLTIARCNPIPNAEPYDDEVKAAFKNRYGIEDGEFLVLYELDGEYRMGGMALWKYDGGWHIAELFSREALQFTKESGEPMPKVSLEEYEAIIALFD